jgi:hypothetical protein
MRRALLVALLSSSPPALAEVPPSDGGVSATMNVQVADGGDTTIEVVKGEVKVSAGGHETRVLQGQGALVKRGQSAKKISLLAAPAPVAPSDGARLGTVDVSLGWSRVGGARSYHLAIAADAEFARPVHDASQIPDERVTVKLAAGTYYWRVRAVDREGLEGKLSPPRRFVVDTTPPRLKAGQPQWKP